MKIVHLNASDKGGASIVAQRLNAALNQYTTVSSQHLIFDSSRSDLPETEVWANTPIRKLRALMNHALDKFDFLQYERDPSIRFQFNHARIGVDISEHPLILNADIIHIHWILKGFLSFDSLKKLLSLGKPVVWTCHDLWPFTGGCFYLWGCEQLSKGCGTCPYMIHPEATNSPSFWLDWKMHNLGAANIYWASPSQWLAEIAKTSPIMGQNTRISVIPNPIRVSDFKVSNPSEKKLIRECFGLKSNVFTVVFSAANLENPAKGFPDFVALIAHLRHREIQAIVIGRSEITVDLPVPCYNAGYVSDVSHVRALFSAADLYITTSQEDNLPTTVMESLACGVPSLGYQIGGIPELIDNGVNGFVYPKGEWKQMAEGVVKLIDNPLLLAEFSANARSKAEVHYDEAKVAKQYAELYHSIILK